MAKVKSKTPIHYNDRSSSIFLPFSRRMFLRHVGGLIAIPLLPSLLSRDARAAVSNANSYRRALFMVNAHGGHYDDADPQGVNYQEIAPNLRVGSLQGATLGPIYNDAYNALSSKLTVIKGLDLGVATTHSIATALAASEVFHNLETGTGGGKYERYSAFPESIDTLLSKSSKVYDNPQGQRIPVLRLSPIRKTDHSHCFENYRSLPALNDLNAVRNLVQSNIVIEPAQQTSTPTDQTLSQNRKRIAIETALLSLNATQKKSQIGREDKIQLEQYQSLLESLRNRVPTSETQPTNPNNELQMCQNIPQDGGNDAEKMAQIMVAALACGVTKIGYMRMLDEHYYAHRVNQPESRTAHKNYLRNTALPIGAYTMGLMDQIQESNGKTLLDNSCVLITSELANSRPHNCVNMRVLIGGSLNGKFRTGIAIDYMNRNHRIQNGLYNEGSVYKPLYGGRLYNELLISILNGFELTPSDYERQVVRYQPTGDPDASKHPKEASRGFGTYECLGKNFCSSTVGGKGQAVTDYINYFYNVYTKNYNRNTVLPHFYI